MKRIALLILLSGVAMADTIPVTGFGSFSLDNFYDTFANVCLFGQGISTCLNNVPIGPAAPVVLSQLTSMDVSGQIEITSYQEFGTRFVGGALNDNWWARGTFDVVSSPEPRPGMLVGVSILMGLLYAYVGRKRR